MTVETAIPEDVEVKEIVVGNTARNDMLSGIAERARQERDQEMKASGQEPVDTMNIEVKEEKEENAQIERIWGNKNFRGFYQKFKYDSKKSKEENVNLVIRFLHERIREK